MRPYGDYDYWAQYTSSPRKSTRKPWYWPTEAPRKTTSASWNWLTDAPVKTTQNIWNWPTEPKWTLKPYDPVTVHPNYDYDYGSGSSSSSHGGAAAAGSVGFVTLLVILFVCLRYAYFAFLNSTMCHLLTTHLHHSLRPSEGNITLKNTNSL